MNYYYNGVTSTKPDISFIHPVGSDVSFSSKAGGGRYVVVGHVNCERCKIINEQREVQEPNQRQKKNGTYYEVFSWCHGCGLYKPDENTKKHYSFNLKNL